LYWDLSGGFVLEIKLFISALEKGCMKQGRLLRILTRCLGVI